MASILSSLKIETDPVAIYNEMMETLADRKARILAKMDHGHVLEFSSGLYLGHGNSTETYAPVQFEHAIVLRHETIAKALAAYPEFSADRPAVIPASKARYRALGRVLRAMAELAENIGAL